MCLSKYLCMDFEVIHGKYLGDVWCDNQPSSLSLVPVDSKLILSGATPYQKAFGLGPPHVYEGLVMWNHFAGCDK